MSIFLTIPIYSMQNGASNERKKSSSLAEIVEGYSGYPFSKLTDRTANTDFDRIGFFFLSTVYTFFKKQLHFNVADVNKMTHGFEKLVKKVIIPKNYYIKTTINCSKILLGFGGATYFYLSDVNHKYAYCAGALLFAYNSYTNGTFAKNYYCSPVQGALKFVFEKNSTIDDYINSWKRK